MRERPRGSPKRSMKRLRTANAACSETCCAVIDDTSASNGSGASGGRKPGNRSTVAARTGSPCAKAWNGSRSNSSPSSLRTTGSIVASSGSTSHAAGGRRDPDLAPVDDAVQAAVVPDVRAVDAPEREAVERELEVVRLRNREQTHAAEASASRRAEGRFGRCGGRAPAPGGRRAAASRGSTRAERPTPARRRRSPARAAGRAPSARRQRVCRAHARCPSASPTCRCQSPSQSAASTQRFPPAYVSPS